MRIRPHRLDVDFSGDVPRTWVRGRRMETHLVNALGLIFPAGERFFVRTARSVLDQVVDPALRDDVKGFIAQEVHHAHQHGRSFAVLERQGISVQPLLNAIDVLIERVFEPATPQVWRVSVTAALEHFTATFAEFAFASDTFEGADPKMSELFMWHAAEEIEHKAVAFDLLQSIDPRYHTRVIGMALACPLLVSFWWGTAIALAAQDRPLKPLGAVRECLAALREGRLATRELAGAVQSYLAPGFHPRQDDNYHRATGFFAAREVRPVRSGVA